MFVLVRFIRCRPSLSINDVDVLCAAPPQSILIQPSDTIGILKEKVGQWYGIAPDKQAVKNVAVFEGYFDDNVKISDLHLDDSSPPLMIRVEGNAPGHFVRDADGVCEWICGVQQEINHFQAKMGLYAQAKFVAPEDTRTFLPKNAAACVPTAVAVELIPRSEKLSWVQQRYGRQVSRNEALLMRIEARLRRLDLHWPFEFNAHNDSVMGSLKSKIREMEEAGVPYKIVRQTIHAWFPAHDAEDDDGDVDEEFEDLYSDVDEMWEDLPPNCEVARAAKLQSSLIDKGIVLLHCALPLLSLY